MSNLIPDPQHWHLLITFLGVPAVHAGVSKVLDTVRDQVNFLLEPTHIRRKAQAEADAAITKAKADALIVVGEHQTELILTEMDKRAQEMDKRAQERVRKLESRRQKNIEAVTVRAAQEVPESVSDDPVDPDWVAQLSNHCQDVSNEEMQRIWGHLLAGEVAKPGSFSLQTLAVVRIMTKDDAELFTRFGCVLWKKGDEFWPIIPDYKELETRFRLSVTNLIHLESLGLIKLDFSKGFSIPNSSGPLHYYGQAHSFVLQGKETFHIGVAMLTKVGQELAAIAGATPNEEYRQWAVSAYRKEGWTVIES